MHTASATPSSLDHLFTLVDYAHPVTSSSPTPPPDLLCGFTIPDNSLNDLAAVITRIGDGELDLAGMQIRLLAQYRDPAFDRPIEFLQSRNDFPHIGPGRQSRTAVGDGAAENDAGVIELVEPLADQAAEQCDRAGSLACGAFGQPAAG